MQAAWSGTFGDHADSEKKGKGRAAFPVEVEVRVRTPCATVMARLVEAFRARELRVYPSFDLQTALQRLPRCGCPHHGKGACTCQYVVWLVYAADEEPVLVLLHGRGSETWITLSASDVQQSEVYDVLMNTLTVEYGA